MAKESREGKSKLRVLFGFAEVEGSDASIQDALRNFTAAVTRAAQPQQLPPRAAKTLPVSEKPSTNGDAKGAGLFDNGHQAEEREIEVEAEQILDGEFEPVQDVQEKKQKPPRKAPTYTLIGDLNLRPSGGKPSLKEFYAQKKPSDQQEQSAVFVYYLTRTLGLSKVGVNHLFSCFKDVGVRVPKDILMVARNTVKRKGWIDASDPDNLRITTQGENFVEHDLPPKASN